VIRIACSSRVQSTESLEAACALVRELGFSLVDCGGIAEGYEVADETRIPKQLLLAKGLAL
jgi:predicted dinucleotide-binding enzyme